MMKPMGERVLIKHIESTEPKTVNGIYLPDNGPKSQTLLAKVMALSISVDGGDLKVGDTIHVGRYNGLRMDEEGLVLLEMKDILAKEIN